MNIRNLMAGGVILMSTRLLRSIYSCIAKCNHLIGYKFKTIKSEKRGRSVICWLLRNCYMEAD